MNIYENPLREPSLNYSYLHLILIKPTDFLLSCLCKLYADVPYSLFTHGDYEQGDHKHSHKRSNVK